MKYLVWSDNLARAAQRWADQFIFTRDQFRDLPSIEVGPVTPNGQNVYGYLEFESTVLFPFDENTQRAHFQEAIEAWHNEVRNFDYRAIPWFVNNRPTNRYTQMLWGKVTHVGCG